jgi:hypothetical protein
MVELSAQFGQNKDIVALILVIWWSSVNWHAQAAQVSTRSPNKHLTISHFPIEQSTGSSRLFGGTKKTQYAEYGI